MPDPYDRHGRPGRWDYAESQPSRGEQRKAAAQEHLHPEIIPEGKRPPGKKNPDLCKGRHWKGPHQGELVTVILVLRQKECGWRVRSWGDESVYWFCHHQEHCRDCGKVLRISLYRDECPLYHDITPSEQEVLDRELEAALERRAKWRIRRRPVITGPQGYRKKR
jgi:hypothetical protein